MLADGVSNRQRGFAGSLPRVPAQRRHRYPTRKGGRAQPRARAKQQCSRAKQAILKRGMKVPRAVVMRSPPHRVGNHKIVSSFYPSQAFGTRGTTRGTVRMRNTLLISTAALLAGVALASAQNMPGGGEQRGGAAQQSQSAPGSETQRGHDMQGPSQQRTQGQSQRGQKEETTGQAPQSQRDQGAQQERGKQGQSQQPSQGQQQRDQTTGQSQRQQDQQAQPQRQQRDQTQGQAPQRQQGQQGQTGQQGQSQQGQAQQGPAGSSVSLTTEQRTKIRQTVLAGGNVPRTSNVNFSINVGTAVPTSVRVVEVPSVIVDIHPEWRGFWYFVVGDEIIIVDRGHKIVAILAV